MRSLSTLLLVLLFVTASYAQQKNHRLTPDRNTLRGVQDTEVIEPELKLLAIDERPDKNMITAIVAVKEGNNLWRQGKFKLSITSYLLATELHPDLYATHYNLGAAKLRINQFAEAATAFQQALSIRPESAQAWQGLGLTHHGLRDLAFLFACRN
jgi:tetratricopeptide (TPR) repeat protein